MYILGSDSGTHDKKWIDSATNIGIRSKNILGLDALIIKILTAMTGNQKNIEISETKHETDIIMTDNK